jgi:hypothetical protein
MASAGPVRLRWSGLDMSGAARRRASTFARVRVGETEFVGEWFGSDPRLVN